MLGEPATSGKWCALCWEAMLLEWSGGRGVAPVTGNQHPAQQRMQMALIVRNQGCNSSRKTCDWNTVSTFIPLFIPATFLPWVSFLSLSQSAPHDAHNVSGCWHAVDMLAGSVTQRAHRVRTDPPDLIPQRAETPTNGKEVQRRGCDRSLTSNPHNRLL